MPSHAPAPDPLSVARASAGRPETTTGGKPARSHPRRDRGGRSGHRVPSTRPGERRGQEPRARPVEPPGELSPLRPGQAPVGRAEIVRLLGARRLDRAHRGLPDPSTPDADIPEPANDLQPPRRSVDGAEPGPAPARPVHP